MRNFGLINLKNNCFINCILQLLILIKPLQEYFSNNDFLKITDNKLIYHFVSLLRLKTFDKSMCKRYKITSILNEIYNSMNIKENEQFDAHEFLLMFINSIHENLKIDLLKPKKKYDNKINFWWGKLNKNDFSIMKQILYGQIKNTIKCDCGITRSRELFFDLIIMPDKNISSSLFNLLNSEFLCEKCNSVKKIKKKIEILPKYLFFVISKFNENLRKSFNNFEEIETTLNLSSFIKNNSNIENTSYNLKSIINHYGNTSNGHYNITIKENDNYIIIDDESIYKIDKFNFDNAYILMYEIDLWRNSIKKIN